MPSTFFHGTTIAGLGRLSSPATIFSAAELLAIEESDIERRDRSRAAVDRVIADIRAAALRGVIETTKRRARAYIRRPSDLNGLGWNLYQAEAEEGISEVMRLARQDGSTIQLGAALLAFRWARRAERNGRMEELLFGIVA